MAGKKLKRSNRNEKIKQEESSKAVAKSKNVEDENLNCNDKGLSKKSEEDSNIRRCINKVIIKPIVKIKATVEGLETSMV